MMMMMKGVLLRWGGKERWKGGKRGRRGKREVIDRWSWVFMYVHVQYIHGLFH